MKKKEIIKLEDVSFGYAKRPVINDVSVSFKEGEIVSILGPNGSGKTTLLKLLLGFRRPVSGRIFLSGEDISDIPPKQLARRIAYVPQDHRSAFAYRVMDMVLMGRAPHKPFFFRYTDDDRAAAMAAMERLSITGLKDRPYTEVSGGERQLTLIARAMTQGADIFIMDEPVNGLDYGNQLRLLGRIAELAGNGYTFIKTTHFPDHALWISDRVVLLKSGRIIAAGPTEEVVNRRNLFRLYATNVDVMQMNGGGRICVPEVMKHFTAASGDKRDYSVRCRHGVAVEG